MDYFKKGILRKASEISLSERHQIIKDYLSGGYTKTEVWERYTGQTVEHGQILRWMRMYGYIAEEVKRRPIFTSNVNNLPMDSKYDDLDKAKLQARIKELEKQLEDAKLREEGYRTMIEIAEKTFKIPIRKKSDTK